VKEYEESYRKRDKQAKQQKKTEQTLDDWFVELRVPIIISLLYLVFQSPIFQLLVFKRLSFLPIYQPDGNLNTQGLFFKSALFGATYYAFTKVIEYVQ
jgi:hypothetical protein